MSILTFGKAQRLTGEAAQALTQAVKPAFHMVRFPTVFVDLLMTRMDKGTAKGVPLVTEGATASIVVWHSFP